MYMCVYTGIIYYRRCDDELEVTMHIYTNIAF